jgi:chemotaxis protein MotB
MAGHGGAWKVAFADFMTAMMALFLVLWISAQDQKILIATSKYFRSPFSSPMTEHSGVMPFNSDSKSNTSSSDEAGQGKSSDSPKQIQLQFLNSVAADFSRMLNLDQVADQDPLKIQVTSEGLRITLFDRPNRPVFAGDTANFTEYGETLMQNLSWMIERNHFNVIIDGHTRAGLPIARPDYSAWDLSADRANATRRLLVHYAVDAAQIERVAGYADTIPLAGEKPEAEANQRVTISLSMKGKSRDAEQPTPENKPAARSSSPLSLIKLIPKK